MFEQIHQTTTQQLRYVNFPRSRDEVSLDQSGGGDSDARAHFANLVRFTLHSQLHCSLLAVQLMCGYHACGFYTTAADP